MTKYRIVEAKIPKLFPDATNVEYLETLFFGLIKRWNKCGSYYKLEQAKAQIEFLNTKETWTVIDVD